MKYLDKEFFKQIFHTWIVTNDHLKTQVVETFFFFFTVLQNHLEVWALSFF